jgi:hypothetical protein
MCAKAKPPPGQRIRPGHYARLQASLCTGAKALQRYHCGVKRSVERLAAL